MKFSRLPSKTVFFEQAQTNAEAYLLKFFAALGLSQHDLYTRTKDRAQSSLRRYTTFCPGRVIVFRFNQFVCPF